MPKAATWVAGHRWGDSRSHWTWRWADFYLPGKPWVPEGLLTQLAQRKVLPELGVTGTRAQEN